MSQPQAHILLAVPEALNWDPGQRGEAAAAEHLRLNKVVKIWHLLTIHSERLAQSPSLAISTAGQYLTLQAPRAML